MTPIAPRAEAATGRAIERLARGLAYLGGVILVSVAVMVCVSIIGRQFDGIAFFRPVRGDYELVELGCVIAVCAFLPWCQLKRGHVAVDIVVQAMPYRAKAFSGLVGDILISIVAFVMAWRLWAGFGEKFPHFPDGLREALGMGARPSSPRRPTSWSCRSGSPTASPSSASRSSASRRSTPCGGRSTGPFRGWSRAHDRPRTGACRLRADAGGDLPARAHRRGHGGDGFRRHWIVLGRPTPALAQLKSLTYDTFKDYNLSIVPLFLLMGQFATKSGMSSALFQAASDWLGHRKGGIAMASVGACAGFGAICGSSLATASTMGQVALPEMRKRGYSDSLSTGVLAAGGTLGILIPPSIILVIYAILAEQNIVKMFVAAIVPGILAALGYMLAVAVYVRVRPGAATTAERVPYGERLRTLARVWPVVGIFGLVMGGIAADWDWTQDGVQALFTPTEGAAVGAVATGLYGMFTRGLTWKGFLDSVLATAQATAMIFFIVWGAKLFNGFLALTRAPISW
jgi:hypothetical protein